MTQILTPRCPLCDRLPEFAVGPTQAFCGNDDCTLLCWDPSLSLDANLLDAGMVVPPPEEGSGG